MTSTDDVAGHLDHLEGGLQLLLMAAKAADPHKEIEWRVQEELRQIAIIRALLESQANALSAMKATLARVARVDNSLVKQLSESIATNAGLSSERDTLRARLKEAEKVVEDLMNAASYSFKGDKAIYAARAFIIEGK